MPTARIAVLTLVAVAACDPEPHYPPVDPLPPGLIETEADLVARDDGPVEFSVVDRVTLSIPAGALPAGTNVKVRSLVAVGDLGKPVSGARRIYPWSANFGYRAVEILPASLVFAKPATLTAPKFTYDGSTCVAVLLNSEAAWQVVGQAMVSEPDFFEQVSVTASVPHGGVWSLSYVDGCSTADGGTDARGD